MPCRRGVLRAWLIEKHGATSKQADILMMKRPPGPLVRRAIYRGSHWVDPEGRQLEPITDDERVIAQLVAYFRDGVTLWTEK